MAVNKRHRPITDTDRERIRELHAQGLSRNEIARQLNRGQRTVSNLAAAMGLTFDRAYRTGAATEARKMDAAARRAELALQLLDDVEKLRARAWAPYEVTGNSVDGPVSITIDLPPLRDAKDAYVAVAVAIDKHLALVRHDTSTGVEGVISLLDKLAGGLALKYGSGDDEHPVDTDA